MQRNLLPILVFLFCHLNWTFGRPMLQPKVISETADHVHADLSPPKCANSACPIDKVKEKQDPPSTTKPIPRETDGSSETDPLLPEKNPLDERPQSEHESSKLLGSAPDQLEQEKDGKKVSFLARFKQALANWYRGKSLIARVVRGLATYFNPAKLRNRKKDGEKAEEVAKAEKSTTQAKEGAKPADIPGPVSDEKPPKTVSDEKPPKATEPETPDTFKIGATDSKKGEEEEKVPKSATIPNEDVKPENVPGPASGEKHPK